MTLNPNTLTREEFMALAKEMIKKDNSIFSELTKEIENKTKEREKMIEEIIKNDFKRYRKVFKALA